MNRKVADPNEAFARFMAEVSDILGDREAVSSSQALDAPTILTQEGSVPCANLSEIPSFSTSQVTPTQPYSSHKQSTQLTPDQLSQLLKDYEIHTEGENIPDPVFSFSGFPFDKNLLDRIEKAGYEKPTPIQSIGVPCVMKSRDVLAISQTGTGKTAVYVWPMVSHIAASRPVRKDEGPIALILVPTRELCIQVYNEAKKYCRLYGQKVVAIYGGVPKHEQWKELKGRCEAIVATPARLIDLIEKKTTSLKRVTYLVLDEADEMFNMGFEYQCKSIISSCPKERQTLLFSATFKPKIQHLAEESLRNPIKIVIGKTGQVRSNQSNLDIRQEILSFKDYSQKLPWLLQTLPDLSSQGSVLIFVKHRSSTEELASLLRDKGISVANLHGDMEQFERDTNIDQFRRGQARVLVATDVASRGLDIPTVRSVINYDCAKDIETHTNRIGRTGRAGELGTAYSLLTRNDKRFAGELMLSLEYNGEKVPESLEKLALQDNKFRALKARHGATTAELEMRAENLKSAREIVASMPKIDMSSIDFRSEVQNVKKHVLGQEFKRAFVPAERLETTLKEPTVSFFPKKRERED